MATTINALAIRKRLGKALWTQPFQYGQDGWCWGSADLTKAIIATPRMVGGVEWIHASIGYRDEALMPGQEDLKLLHTAVFDGRFAYQVFGKPEIPGEVHMWGRADGLPALPVGL